MFSWYPPRKIPLIIAHRGASAVAPENTLASFRQALRDGADAVELDIHLTGDREVVVIHDERLERTTTGRGRVRDHSFKELKRLSAGSWFGRNFSSEHVPSLAEVLDTLAGRVGVNIEIKMERLRRQRFDIVERCLQTVQRCGASKYVLVSSFHHPFVKLVKALDPDIATGVLYHPLRHFRKPVSRLIRQANAGSFICNKNLLRKSLVRSLHRRGYFVGAYTVNSPTALSSTLRMGADYIYSDNPAMVSELLAQRPPG